jgi:hypothetical protein
VVWLGTYLVDEFAERPLHLEKSLRKLGSDVRVVQVLAQLLADSVGRLNTVLLDLSREVLPEQPPVGEQVQHAASDLPIVVVPLPLRSDRPGGDAREPVADHADLPSIVEQDVGHVGCIEPGVETATKVTAAEPEVPDPAVSAFEPQTQ